MKPETKQRLERIAAWLNENQTMTRAEQATALGITMRTLQQTIANCWAAKIKVDVRTCVKATIPGEVV